MHPFIEITIKTTMAINQNYTMAHLYIYSAVVDATLLYSNLHGLKHLLRHFTLYLIELI